MPDADPATVTRLLRDAAAGDRGAFDAVFPLVYDEFRAVAGRQRGRWRGEHTLDTTALAHEVYLKLAGAGGLGVADRAHFFAVAARAARQVLVTYADGKRAQKRGGGAVHVALLEGDGVAAGGLSPDEVLALDDALGRLERVSEREARIVECRLFGGLSVDETAAALGVSPATVKRGWALARAWLRRELG